MDVWWDAERGSDGVCDEERGSSDGVSNGRAMDVCRDVERGSDGVFEEEWDMDRRRSDDWLELAGRAVCDSALPPPPPLLNAWKGDSSSRRRSNSGFLAPFTLKNPSTNATQVRPSQNPDRMDIPAMGLVFQNCIHSFAVSAALLMLGAHDVPSSAVTNPVLHWKLADPSTHMASSGHCRHTRCPPAR